MAATKGRGKFPPVRTFKGGLDYSTNSIYHDMQHAQSWSEPSEAHVAGLIVVCVCVCVCRSHVGEDCDKVDISELTWEQKEQVLKLLFFKMNASTADSAPSKPLPSLQAPATPTPSSITRSPQPPPPPNTGSPGVFLTQAIPPTSTTTSRPQPPTHAHRMVVSSKAA